MKTENLLESAESLLENSTALEEPSKEPALTFFDLGLIPDICERVTSIGYIKPTPIQEEAIPQVLDGHDVIGIAQTGTGKTAAFLLPLIDSLLVDPPQKHRERPRVLVLSPTRELATQTYEAAVSFLQGTTLRAVVIFGGVSQKQQEREIGRGAEIMIATPGRLNDLINQRKIALSQAEFLVLDEADRMLDMGFLPQIKRVLSHMPRDRQTLMFSATLSHEIEELARRALIDPVLVEVGGRRKPAEGVTQTAYPVMRLHKPELLLHLLQDLERGSTMIFTKTKHDADRVAHVLGRAGINVTKIHSDLTQRDRTKALDGFRNGTFDTIVATDVASRGLDIEDVSHVFNYEPPMSADDYVHRVGRTARAEKTGDAITLVSPEEEPMMREIERRIEMEIPRVRIEKFAPPPPIEISAAERRRLKGWSRR